MNVITVNGRTEFLTDVDDGVEIARDIMGDEWYSAMKAELAEMDAYSDSLEQDVEEYQSDYESALEEKDRLLGDIQELAEQCIKEEIVTGPTTKRMQKIFEYLDAIKNICYKNT